MIYMIPRMRAVRPGFVMRITMLCVLIAVMRLIARIARYIKRPGQMRKRGYEYAD